MEKFWAQRANAERKNPHTQTRRMGHPKNRRLNSGLRHPPMDAVHMIYDSLFDKRFLLGLLNSRFLNFYHGRLVPEFGKAFAEVKIANLERLPAPRIRLSDPSDKARHDKMVVLVERMLDLNKRKHSGKLAPSELQRLEREIAATDAEIDDLVYELYGITEEERKIIEGNV